MLALLFLPLAIADWQTDLTAGSMNNYLTFSEVQDALDAASEAYTNVSAIKILGTSTDNNNLYYVDLIKSGGQATKSGILVSGCLTTENLACSAAVLYNLNKLAIESEANATLLKLSNYYFAPVLNPDALLSAEDTFDTTSQIPSILTNLEAGTEACDQPEQALFSEYIGVNLNRNFSFQWGVDDTGSSDQECSREYRGATAASTDEVKAIRSFILNKNIKLWVHYDGVGSNYYIPYGYSSTETLETYDQYFYDTFKNAKAVTMGNYFELDNRTVNGCLIDYAYSTGILAFQVNVGTTGADVAGINSVLDSRYSAFTYLYQNSAFKFGLQQDQSQTTECMVDNTNNCEGQGAYKQTVVKFKLANSGLGDSPDVEVLFDASYTSDAYQISFIQAQKRAYEIGSNGDSVTLTQVTVTDGTSTSAQISKVLNLGKLSSLQQVDILLTLESTKDQAKYTDQEIVFTYSFNSRLKGNTDEDLANYSNQSKTGTIDFDKDIDVDGEPDTDGDKTPIDTGLWSWGARKSGDHQEGAMVAVSTLFISLFLIGILVFIVLKWRKSQNEEAGDNARSNFNQQPDQQRA